MTLEFLFKELRGHKKTLIFILISLTIGVIGYTSTARFSDATLATLKTQTRLLVGYDVGVRSNSSIPQKFIDKATTDARVDNWAIQNSLITMAEKGSFTAPIEVRAVSQNFPLLNTTLTTPSDAFRNLEAGILIERALSDKLKVRQGDSVTIAGSELMISGYIDEEAGREVSALLFSGRVYMSIQQAKKIGLLSPMSRFSETLLLTLKQETKAEEFSEHLKKLSLQLNTTHLRPRTSGEATTSLLKTFQNLNSFLSLIGMALLLLSSFASALTLKSFFEARRKDAAIFKTLGMLPNLISRTYILLIVFLILTSTLLGNFFGVYLCDSFIFPSLQKFLPFELSQGMRDIFWEVPVALLAMIVLFCYATIKSVNRTSPLLLLRSINIPTIQKNDYIFITAAFVALLIFVAFTSFSPKAGLATGGAAFFVLVLFIFTTRSLMNALNKVAHAQSLSMAIAFKELGARSQSASLIAALIGLSFFLIVLVQITKSSFSADFLYAQGETAPNVYFIDVQKNQIEEVKALSKQVTSQDVVEAPIVKARVSKINGVSVQSEEIKKNLTDEGKRFLNREQNLTYKNTLGNDEEIIKGQFWSSETATTTEVSLEERFAERINANLNDEIVFDIQGIPVSARVTSLRKVRWQSLRPNFFIVAHPSLIKEAPQTFFVAARASTPETRALLTARITDKFPNLTSIDATAILQNLAPLTQGVATSATILASLMLIVALSTLATSLLNTSKERLLSFSLLRTLGAPDSVLRKAIVYEFLLLSVAAVGIGAVTAGLAGFIYTKYVFEVSLIIPWLTLINFTVFFTAFIMIIGFIGVSKSMSRSPLQVLRSNL